MTKDLAASALCALRADALWRFFTRRSVLVVGYHGVTETPLIPPCPWILGARELEQQLRWLAEHYRVAPLEDVAESLAIGRALPSRTAVITFDDGYASVLTTAVPLLHDLGLPATVFVVTGAVGRPEPLWPDRLYLALTGARAARLDLTAHGGGIHELGSPALAARALGAVAAFLKGLPVAKKAQVLEEVEAQCQPVVAPQTREVFALLDADGIRAARGTGVLSVGSHAHEHEILSRLDAPAQREAIDASMAWLRPRVESARLAFAYPNGRDGDFDAGTIAAVRAAGFTCAVTAIGGLNTLTTDLFALRRVIIGHGLTMARVRLRTCGATRRLRDVPSPVRLAMAGLRFRLRPVRRFAREYLFKRDTVLVYTRPSCAEAFEGVAPARGDGFVFARASVEQLEALAARRHPRDRAAFLAEVRARQSAGKECLAMLHEGRVVSSIWLDRGPRVFIPEVESVLDVGQNAIYLYDASTLPEWRGRGLYPTLLRCAAADRADRRVFIATSEGNVASKRGIEKAGFTIVGRRSLLKVAGVVLQSASAGT